MFLDENTFKTVIASTPLVSIDLVVKNPNGEYLLGYRNNRPAQGFWFVPGGRILKNESLATAFKRLTLEELGCEYDISHAILQGAYDHFYDDYVFGEEVATHYVAISHKLTVNQADLNLPLIQHGGYQWFEKEAILNDDKVHKHTKWYFE